jgi:hypothetical protein
LTEVTLKAIPHILLAAFLLALAACSRPDPVAVSGRVVDVDGEGIEGALVLVEGSSVRTSTGEDGRYIVRYDPGRFSLRFEAEGYSRATLQVTVSPGQVADAGNVALFTLPPAPGVYLYLDHGFIRLRPNPTAQPGSGALGRAGIGPAIASGSTAGFVLYGTGISAESLTVSSLSFDKGSGRWAFGANVPYSVRRFDAETPLMLVEPATALPEGLYALDWGLIQSAASPASQKVYDFEVVPRAHAAAWRGEIGSVAAALADDPGAVNALSVTGRTPLFYAASGHTSVTGLLLDSGAKANVADVAGLTPLAYAAFTNSPETVSLLVMKGARTAQPSKDVSLVDEAKRSGFTNVVASLLGQGTVPAETEEIETPDASMANRARVYVPYAVRKAWSGVRVRLTDRATSQSMDISVDLKRPSPMGSTGLTLVVDYFLPHYVLSDGVVTSTGTDALNPAAFFTVTEDGATVHKGWVFARFPEVAPVEHQRYEIILLEGRR